MSSEKPSPPPDKKQWQFGPLTGGDAMLFSSLANLCAAYPQEFLAAKALKQLDPNPAFHENNIVTEETLKAIKNGIKLNAIINFTGKGLRGYTAAWMPPHLQKEYKMHKETSNAVTSAAIAGMDTTRTIISNTIRDLGNGHSMPDGIKNKINHAFQGSILSLASCFGRSLVFLKAMDETVNYLIPDNEKNRALTIKETAIATATTTAATAPIAAATFAGSTLWRRENRLNPEISFQDAARNVIKEILKKPKVLINTASVGSFVFGLGFTALGILVTRYGITHDFDSPPKPEGNPPLVIPPPSTHVDFVKAKSGGKDRAL